VCAGDPTPLTNQTWLISMSMRPVINTSPDLAPLTSGCNGFLQMTFEDQINILVYFDLEEHHSGCHLCGSSRRIISPGNT
jgi:hypothetical protein